MNGKLDNPNEPITLTPAHLERLKSSGGGYSQTLITYAQKLTGEKTWLSALSGRKVTKAAYDAMLEASKTKKEKQANKRSQVLNAMPKPDGHFWKPEATDYAPKKFKTGKKGNAAKRDAVSRLQDADFRANPMWLRLRVRVLVNHGQKCSLCGATPCTGAVLDVHHKIPRSKRPDLTLDYNNLHVLCDDCKNGKADIYGESWRDVEGEQRAHDLALLDRQAYFIDPQEREILMERRSAIFDELKKLDARLKELDAFEGE